MDYRHQRKLGYKVGWVDIPTRRMQRTEHLTISKKGVNTHIADRAQVVGNHTDVFPANGLGGGGWNGRSHGDLGRVIIAGHRDLG